MRLAAPSDTLYITFCVARILCFNPPTPPPPGRWHDWRCQPSFASFQFSLQQAAGETTSFASPRPFRRSWAKSHQPDWRTTASVSPSPGYIPGVSDIPCHNRLCPLRRRESASFARNISSHNHDSFIRYEDLSGDVLDGVGGLARTIRNSDHPNHVTEEPALSHVPNSQTFDDVYLDQDHLLWREGDFADGYQAVDHLNQSRDVLAYWKMPAPPAEITYVCAIPAL